MSARAQSQDDAVVTDAERWLARLHSPDCTANERVEFERWRSADAAHAAAYVAAERLWTRVQELADDPAVAAAFANAKSRSFWRLGAKRYLFTPLGLAASLVAATLLGFAAFRLVGAPENYRTDLGEQREVTLADGSSVVLDTASALRVELDSKHRMIYLDGGQAHFAVARDSARPFIVKAGGSVITALGTSFDVRNERAEITVTLMQGRVAVTPASEKDGEILLPGERVTISATTGLKHKQKMVVDVDASSAWTQGNLIFKDTELQDAISEINRYTPQKIRIGDSSLAAMPISGVFHVGDPVAVVIALQRSFPISAASGPNGETLLTRDPSRSAP